MGRKRTYSFQRFIGVRLAVFVAFAAIGFAQPAITSLGSSFTGVTVPTTVTGVTIDSLFPDFTLYVNGTFNPNLNPFVIWTDPVTNSSQSLGAFSVTPTEMRVAVPADLYLSVAVGSQQRNVQITVSQNNLVSNALPFALNAVMSTPPSPLPVATVGVPYSAALVNNGTAPYLVSPGSVFVPGMTIGTGVGNQFIAGTPTQVGQYDVSSFIEDNWDNSIFSSLALQVIANATLTSISTNFAPAGSGLITITVTGSNFIDPQQSIVGSSIVQWTFNNVVTSLATTYVSPTQLTAVIPTALMSAPGQASISVLQPNNIATPGLPFTLGAPSLSTISPNNVLVSSPAVTLNITGVNFASRVGAPDVSTPPFTPVVTFGNNVLSSTLNNAGSITALIPSNLLVFPGTFPVRVTNPGGAATGTINFTVGSTLAITASSLPPGTAGSSYSYRLTATGGQSPYIWNVTGLPAGLTANPQTGDITGTPNNAGTFPISVRVTDSFFSTAQATLILQINSRPPAVITTPSTLPNGTVGVPYSVVIESTGTGPFTYSVSSGQLPDGLRLSSNGTISGTPTRAATFSFLVVVDDGLGNSPNKSFTIVIQPSTLAAGDVSTTLTVGTPASITLTATGGVSPYRFSLICTLPAGLSFSAPTISGTPTTPGTTTCRNVVTDGQGGTAFKDFTITVQPVAVTFTGSALTAGQVGVAYSTTLRATGGIPPFTYSGTGLPAGLGLSSAGAISGTPTTAGPFSFSVTATDSARTSATANFTLTIAPAALTITTTTLPDGTVGTAYSATVAASGGVTPYTFAVTGLPGGLTATPAGAISGTPAALGTSTVAVSVKDAAGATATASLSLRIAAPPIVITTASAPGGTVGTAYTASFAATGGVAPLTWSATGAPAGLTMSSSGVLSGTPTAPGTSNVTVTARDSAGATQSKAFSIAIVLPTAPPLTFGGIPATAPPAQQPRLTVSIGTPYPVDVVVTMTLTFTPDSGADDPAIQFSTGGRTARITIPAGSTTGATDVGVQTGTVAGVINVTSQLQASGADVTPSPAPRTTIRINAAAPVLTQVTGARTSTGFTITATGFVTSREITQAIFTFNPTPGTNLQTTTLTVAADAIFATYFTSSAAAPFGSQFLFTQAFTITGNLQGVASVTLTLVNRTGSSNVMTVTF